MHRLPWTFVVCLFSCSIIRSSIIFYISYEMARHVRSSIFIASHMWTPKTHARLCIRTVSQSPLMLAHIKYRTRPRFWTDIKLDGWACSFEDSREGGQKVPKPRVTAHTCMSQTGDSAYTTYLFMPVLALVGQYFSNNCTITLTKLVISSPAGTYPTQPIIIIIIVIKISHHTLLYSMW